MTGSAYIPISDYSDRRPADSLAASRYPIVLKTRAKIQTTVKQIEKVTQMWLWATVSICFTVIWMLGERG